MGCLCSPAWKNAGAVGAGHRWCVGGELVATPVLLPGRGRDKKRSTGGLLLRFSLSVITQPHQLRKPKRLASATNMILLPLKQKTT